MKRHAIAAALGYGLGLIPSADLVAARRGGLDLREVGSGNPGATNAAAVLGPRAGLAVLVGDIAKGAVAGRIGSRLAGAPGANLASVMAVVGHCYPATKPLRGGKGVATSVGQVVATFPPYLPIDLLVAVGTAAVPGWKQRAFAATTVSSIVWTLASFVWWRRSWPTGWAPAASPSLPLGALASSAVIFSRFWQTRARPTE